MEYDNSKFKIPFYAPEQVDELGASALHPHDSPLMEYDKRRHQYLLTRQALIELKLYPEGDNSEEAKELIENTSRAIYSYIKIKAGTLNYAKMMYRIAKGLGAPNISRNDFRTIFLYDILLVTARDIADKGYAKDTPKVVVTEIGRTKTNDLSATDGYWLHDDVITALESLNLTNPQRIRDFGNIRWDEY